MDIKSLFQRDKEAVKFWAEVVSNPQFEKVMIHCKAQMSESGCGKEILAGANYFSQLLEGLTGSEETWAEVPGPGLTHNMPAKQTVKPTQ